MSCATSALSSVALPPLQRAAAVHSNQDERVHFLSPLARKISPPAGAYLSWIPATDGRRDRVRLSPCSARAPLSARIQGFCNTAWAGTYSASQHECSVSGNV